MAARVPRSTALLGSASVRSAEGAALFIDIDGFTALTDRLIGSGHEGVELLHHALARAFGPIVDRIDRTGGDVVHVIGDAVIAVYDGEDAVATAIDTAIWSRSHLRGLELGGHRFSSTSAVSEGRIEFRALGDPSNQRQLVATGRAITAAMSAEHAAAGGSIVVVSPTRSGGRGPSIIERAAPDGESAPSGGRSRPVFVGDDQWVPAVLRGNLTFPAQHKYSDTAFVGVRVPRADWDAASRWYSELVDACAAEGVVLLEADPIATGFRLRLIMGAPIASGSHRASLMAMACHAVDSARSHGLQARAGVCGGRTFVGTILGRRVQRTVVIGDPVNVAARIGAVARPGEVLVERPTALRAGIVPTARPVRRRLRGKPFPTAIAPMTSSDIGAREDGPRPTFVGRERELDLLDHLTLGRGNGHLVCLVGEAGIGKSSLVQAFVQRQTGSGDAASHQAPLVLESDESDARRPLGLAGRLTRAIAERVGDPIPDDFGGLRAWLARHHAELPDVRVDPIAIALGVETPRRSRRDEVGIADRIAGASHELHRVIGLLAERLRTVVIIEDLYFVDPSSSKLIDELSSRADDSNGLEFIVVARPGNEDLHPLLLRGNRIDLEPLADESVRALVASLGLADDRVDAVVREANGNPLHAIELASIAESSDVGELQLGLDGTIERRLDAVGAVQPGVLDALRAAATVGNSAPIAWVASVVDRPRFSSFSPAELAGIAGFARIDDDIITFRHHRIREVVLRHMESRRREIHRGLCRVISNDPTTTGRERALLLGDHATGSGDPRLIWRFERSGADAAIEQLALTDAFERLARAVKAGATLDGTPSSALCRTSIRAARLAEQLGHFEEADSLAEQALTAASSPSEQAQSLALAAMLRRVHGDSEGALEACRRIHDLDFRPRGVTRGELLLTEAAVHHRLGEFQRCMHLAERALSGIGLRDAQRGKAMMLYDIASFDHDRSTRYETEWVELFERVGDVRLIGEGFNNIAVNSYHLGNYRQSIDQSNEAIARFRIIRDPTGEATAVCNKGEVLSDRGDLAGALECFNEGGRLWEQSAEVFGLAYYHRNLGRLAGRRGDPERALAHFEDGKALFNNLGNDDEMSEFLAARLEVEVRAGLRPRSWARSLAELEATDVAIDRHVVLRLSAMVDERRGRVGDAHRSYVEAAELAHNAAAFEEALALLGAARTAADAGRGHNLYETAEMLLDRMEIDRTGWVAKDLEGIG